MNLVWRGRLRYLWESSGFDQTTFQLFMKMKGAKTRTDLLYALSVPRDRLQLAREIGLDWKIVDYHVQTLCRCGLVHEDPAPGRTRMYLQTALGHALLSLLKEVEKESMASVLNTNSPAPLIEVTIRK